MITASLFHNSDQHTAVRDGADHEVKRRLWRLRASRGVWSGMGFIALWDAAAVLFPDLGEGLETGLNALVVMAALSFGYAAACFLLQVKGGRQR